MRSIFRKYVSLFNYTDPLDTWSALVRAGWAYIAFFAIALLAIIPTFLATILANALGDTRVIWIVQDVYFIPMGLVAGLSLGGIFFSACIGWVRYLAGLVAKHA